MTTIVAVENETHALFGSDSQVTAGSQKSSLEAGKIFKNGEYTIAVAGRLRMLQALKHANLPKIPKDAWDIDQFVSSTLGPAIAQIEKDAGCDGDSQYLVAVRTRIYNIHGDGTYLRNPSKHYAIGSGSDYALGSLYGLSGEPTQQDVKTALRAAAKHDLGTSGPFFITEVSA